jgi:CDP-diacylglycerol---glycerol-3-phosphate 3-phosphatidyltransferase
VLNQMIRRGWDRMMKPVGESLARGRVVADVITLLGVAVQAAGAVLILDGRLLAGGIFATIAGVADLLDGAVAKASGTSGKWGALLDSTTDRISDALLFLPVAWLYGVNPDIPARDEPWVAAVALAAFVFGYLVSYVKARAQSLGYECDVGIAERAERLIIFIAGLLANLVPVAVVILAVLTAVTFGQRILHVRSQAKSAV